MSYGIGCIHTIDLPFFLAFGHAYYMASTYTDDFALIQQYRAAAIAALAAGDYNTAVNQALAAQAVLATIPSNAVRGAGPMGGNQSLAWSAEAIDSFIVRCRQQGASIQGITSAPITRANPSQTQGAADSPGEAD